MAGWTRHEGLAVALPVENIDTDQLIPARFMSAPRSDGYGGFLLHDLRLGPDGAPDPDFPLNRHPEASVLIARRNFGSGSSREAAVYALVDAGIRAVLAPSFGDIFFGNAINNGLLPARIDAAIIAELIDALGTGTAAVRIDLEAREIWVGARRLDLALDPVARQKLIAGWDDIDMTASHHASIADFARRRRAHCPWAWPAGSDRPAKDTP